MRGWFLASLGLLGVSGAAAYGCSSTEAPPADDAGVGAETLQPGCKDKGCACSGPGVDCYEGPEGTAGKGACQWGKRDCVQGVLGDCKGQVLPSAEVCNGKDDDCNQKIDDVPIDGGAIDSFEDAAVGCYTALAGVCKFGSRACAKDAGTEPACVPYVQPGARAEECNGRDDDCNGEVDEDLQNLGACTFEGGVGECSKGTASCQNGQPVCTGGMSKPESCDGLDNDCNGSPDNGACEAGTPSCCNLQNFYLCLESDAAALFMEAGLVSGCNK